MFAPAVPAVIEEFDIHSSVIGPLMLSIYILGWMMGPLVLAPLSEVHGRLAVYGWSSALYICFTAVCALAPGAMALVVFRFLAGAVGSAPLTLGGGTISDLIPVRERGRALSFYMVGPILGPAVGPLAGGYLTAAWGWRSIFWGLLGLYLGAAMAQMLIMRETYAPAILTRKTARLRAEARSTQWQSKLNSGLTGRQVLARAVMRPMKLTFLSPVNLFISLASAYINGLLFLVVATLPLIFGREYGFGPKDVGIAFEGIGIGNLVGLAVFALTSDRYIRAQAEKGQLKPEHRLAPVVAAGPLLASGFFWYGWSAQLHAHWFVPIIGTSLIGMGNILFFSAIIGYLIDAFTTHVASAIAANIIIRSLGGTLLPLCGDLLYENLGWGWGSSVLAFGVLLFTPGLLLLYTHGERIRERFRFEL